MSVRERLVGAVEKLICSTIVTMQNNRFGAVMLCVLALIVVGGAVAGGLAFYQWKTA